jgi:hypothetical protein
MIMPITQEGKLRKTQFVHEIVEPSSKMIISARDEALDLGGERWDVT